MINTMQPARSSLLSRLVQPGNLITISGLVAILALATLRSVNVAIGPTLEAILLIYGYRIADELDGRVARLLGQSSVFGELLDLMVDRANDCILSALVLVTNPQLLWFVIGFFVLKIAPEHLLGRVLGIADHKQKSNTKFSKVYTLFHNVLILQFYLVVKTLFFISATGIFSIPYIEWVFISIVAIRSIYVLEMLSYIGNIATKISSTKSANL